MPRRERALASEIRFNLRSTERLSSISPLIHHRLLNLSPLLSIRNQNYLVGAFAFYFSFISFRISFFIN